MTLLFVEEQRHQDRISTLTAKIMLAYVSSNPMPVPDLLKAICGVRHALETLHPPAAPPLPAEVGAGTVFPDYIVSLEDGRYYRSMKKHLAGKGMTPEEYRAKWGLPPDYPMVPPNYSAERSAIAKRLGFGRRMTKSAE